MLRLPVMGPGLYSSSAAGILCELFPSFSCHRVSIWTKNHINSLAASLSLCGKKSYCGLEVFWPIVQENGRVLLGSPSPMEELRHLAW